MESYGPEDAVSSHSSESATAKMPRERTFSSRDWSRWTRLRNSSVAKDQPRHSATPLVPIAEFTTDQALGVSTVNTDTLTAPEADAEQLRHALVERIKANGHARTQPSKPPCAPSPATCSSPTPRWPTPTPTTRST